MALALLDLVGLDGSNARFRIDTGTNRHYQLKLGRGTTSRSGFDWIDDVVYQTPLRENPAGGSLLNTATEISVPTRGLLTGRSFAQLFSYRSRDGRAMGFSPVIAVDRAMTALDSNYTAPESLANGGAADGSVPALFPPRAVSCRTCSEEFSAPRLDDLLAQIVKVAGPIVAQLLAQPGTPGAQAPAAGSPPAAGAAPAVGSLLQAIVGVLPGLLGQLSTPQSIAERPPPAGNRFANGHALARPMVFGIDDALLGAFAGQIVGVLPQLLNSVNQQRVQLQQGNNKLVSDLVGQVERRMLLQQVLQAQQQAQSGQSRDLAQLAALLQQADAAAPAPAPATAPVPVAGVAAPPAAPAPVAVAAPAAPAPVAPVAGQQSLATSLSARAVATFVTAPPVSVDGHDQVLFAKGNAVTLQVKLAVTDPAPTTPLPKAIVRVVVKDPSDQRVLAEKVVKQKGLAANATVPVPFTAQELAGVPTGRPVSLLAEIRWQASGGERKALGSLEAAFTDRLFVKARGGDAGPERELIDMNRFRAFWNKLWESPPLAEGKRLWGLDVTAKYTVLLTTDQPSNGLMETRISAEPPDRESVSLRTVGKMKAGIELSVDELSKLAVLWDGESILDADHLAAFRTAGFAQGNASEAITNVKLEGHREERGLVWVVPVLKLVAFTLGTVQSTDGNGQVTATGEEPAHFPLPTALRVLTLASGDAGETPDGEPTYHFDGYRIDHSDKVALTLHG
jgi:hypothetical protein